MSDPDPPASGLPDGVLALSILLSGVVAAGISSLAVNERMHEIYQNMGVELPGLLQLSMRINAPWVCGVGGSLAAFLVYLVISGRIPAPLPAKLARIGATLMACFLLLFAVGARESMQQSMDGLRQALSQGGPELPPPVPGEAQALVREVVQSVELGLKSSEDGKWSFRGPGQAAVGLSLPKGPAGGTDSELEERVRFPEAGLKEGVWKQVQPAPAASGAELSYAFELVRARVDGDGYVEGSLDPGDAHQDGLYLLRVFVFRGPPGPEGHWAREQFETVLR